MTFHKQVAVEMHGYKTFVDEGMVDLLQAMWERGIVTAFSCQGGEVTADNRGLITKDAYVSLQGEGSLMKFLDAFITYDDEVRYIIQPNLEREDFTVRFLPEDIEAMTALMRRRSYRVYDGDGNVWTEHV